MSPTLFQSLKIWNLSHTPHPPLNLVYLLIMVFLHHTRPVPLSPVVAAAVLLYFTEEGALIRFFKLPICWSSEWGRKTSQVGGFIWTSNPCRYAKLLSLYNEEGKWNFEEETSVMWYKMANCIKRVAKDVFGESKGKNHSHKESWWWNQPRCMSSDPTSDSFFPTYFTFWPQLFRWYPEIEEIEFLPGTHETKIWTR